MVADNILAHFASELCGSACLSALLTSKQQGQLVPVFGNDMQQSLPVTGILNTGRFQPALPCSYLASK